MGIAEWIFIGLLGFVLYKGVKALNNQAEKQELTKPYLPNQERTTPPRSTPINAPVNLTVSTTEPNADLIAKWGEDLFAIWQGECPDVEFTYRGTRRRVTPKLVLKHTNGNHYLHGYCHVRNEDRTFNLGRLETKILMKSKRYEDYEWLDKVVGEGNW